MPGPSEAAERLLSDPAFWRLKDLVVDGLGLAFWQDRDAELAARLAPHLVEHPGLEPGGWLARLTAEGGQGPEADALIARVTVGETFFFRFEEQFAALQTAVLPEIIARRGMQAQMAVWSAGCSNGAEIHSVGILLRTVFADPLAGWRITLVGTDVDSAALRRAQAGLYGDWAVRSLSPDLRHRYFTPATGGWRIRAELRAEINFFRHNLVAEPPPPAAGGWDVIFCRNVLIYFNEVTRHRVLRELGASLAPGGWLIVGASDFGQDLPASVVPVALPGCTLYRKPCLPAPIWPLPGLPLPLPNHGPAATPQAVGSGQLRQRAEALLNRGNFVDAVSLCRIWVTHSPNDPDGHYCLGMALESLDLAAATAELRRAVALDPGFALAHVQLMRLYNNRGQAALADSHRQAVAARLVGQPPAEMTRLLSAHDRNTR